MKLITREIELKLKKNMALPEGERVPVVKFFGGGACTWLISEKEGDVLFGLCDLGLGGAELGYVSLSELESLKFPPFGLGVERDSWFEADKTLSAYADEARELGSLGGLQHDVEVRAIFMIGNVLGTIAFLVGIYCLVFLGLLL
jgi:hypothetical protein